MPTTRQMRQMYPELVKSFNPLICDYAQTTKVPFIAAGTFGETVELRFHPGCAEAFRALAAVFAAWNYRFWDPAGGTCVCRPITGGSKTSLHAHGVALDINPSTNRYRSTRLRGLIQWGKQTDMPKGMVLAAEAIRTKGGFRVFEWGGRWTTKDPMHWQPSKCTRAQLERGIDWSTVQGKPIEDEETMKRGDTGVDVKKLQNYLNRWVKGYDIVEDELTEDGDYGPATEATVKVFQQWARLAVTGVANPITVSTLTALVVDKKED